MNVHDDGRRASSGALWAACAAILLTALLASPARADRYVAVGGSDAANDCSSSGTPCATIAAAVGAASAGEVVHVGAGTFAGSVSINKALTLSGAQAGVAVASRTAGSAAETIIDARGLQSGINVGSGDVVIDGLEVLGDAQTYAGIVLYSLSDLPNVVVQNNFVHGMALKNPFSTYTHFAYGIFGVTGTAGDRKQISGLVVQGNEIYDLGVAGTVAGAAVYMNNVAGATAGDGAVISGNLFRNLATRDTSLNVGAGVIIDAGTDDFLGLPTGPSSGVAVSGNTYVDSAAGVALLAASSSVSEPSTSFFNVQALVMNLGTFATVDTATLGRYVFSNAIVGYPGSEGYFSTIQSAVDTSTASAQIRPTVGEFPELVTLSRGIQLIGPRAGEDARTRDPLLGEATISLGIRIRAAGATVDGVSVTNPGAVAIASDQLTTSAIVRNTIVATAARGIALDFAQNATVTQNLVQDITQDGIAAGTDNGTTDSADDVASVAVIQDNEVVDANSGVKGYLQYSSVSRNVFRDYPSLDLGAGIAGSLVNSVVEKNTVSGYVRGAGVLLTGSPNRPLTQDTTFRCNSFLSNYFGFLVELTQTTDQGIVVRGNTFSGNTIGALNYPPFVLDATNNWWGCAAGPGNAGCDIAGQNIAYSPFLTAQPDCSSCAVDADCSDGLFCNGVETCDSVISQCLPGTPPTCDLGSADPQCNVAVCDQTFGCVVVPVTDGTTCDLDPSCSAPESCVSGVCIPGPGAADDDGDGICNADDTCPNCNYPLTVELARVVRNSGTNRANGKIVVKATFVAPTGSPGQFDVSAPISVLVTDGGSLSFNAAFQLAECTSRRGIVTCKSADRRFNMRVKPFRPRDTAGQQIMMLTLRNLDIGPTFQAPVTVLLRHGNGITRTGSIATCKTAPGLLRCF